MRYKTKPYEIDAIQWTGKNFAEVSEFTGGKVRNTNNTLEVWDYLQATWVQANYTDYVIRGGKGEYYPCNDEVFEAKYEPV